MIRTAIFALCLSSCAATAQENPLISAMQNAGKAYDHCFYQSVFAQMKAQRTDDNYDMMSERAFAACATEESAMVLLAQAGGVPAQTITITLTGLGLSLKRTVRDIVANPAKYAK